MTIYFISEIGINHNGDMSIVKKLIDLAKEAGSDAVKFQKRDIDLVYSKKDLDKLRESPWGSTQREQKQGLELSIDDYSEIDKYCSQVGIDWFASAWDINSLNFLEKFNLKYNKIASPMIISNEILEATSKQKKHTFISTGMSNIQQIDNAVKIFKNNNCSFELMHCISTYPMKPELANLNTINGLRERYKCDVGYSGHEGGIAISYAAAAMGITSLERHITLDRTMYGSDQAASLEPKGLRELIGAIRKIDLAMGEDMTGHVFDDEIPNAEKLRSHIKTY
ncbi:N-acetylneuraminate synthase family protein [Alphaproteobacteria bacterium]|nr:N-acetylneuraminate synthase family protein [Alphaproteobacteria bacterium]